MWGGPLHKGVMGKADSITVEGQGGNAKAEEEQVHVAVGVCIMGWLLTSVDVQSPGEWVQVRVSLAEGFRSACISAMQAATALCGLPVWRCRLGSSPFRESLPSIV